jgi:hypothetical protein
MKTQFLYTAAALALVVSPAFSQQAGPLRAGASKVEITPPKEMFPFKGNQTLGGVHDPLYARALVLDNGSSKIALISADTTGLRNGDEVVKAVSDELKIPINHLSISATHDHNTPTFGGGRGGGDITPYLEFMKKGIVEAARQANAKLQPARIGYATGKAYVNTNRDEKIGNRYAMGYAPEGTTDKTVTVISITSPTGEPIAVWSDYPVHGVVMFLSKTKDGMSEVTSDIGGWTNAYVEDRIKGAVSIWTPGAAGDQNPLFMSTYNQDAPDVHDEGGAGWAILDVLSRRLGEETVRVAKSIQNTTDKAVLWGANTQVVCPGRQPAPNARANAAAPTNNSGSPTAGQAGPQPMVDGDPVTIPLGLLMINDIAIAHVQGEVFTDISLKLKKDSLFDRTVMATLSGGSIGYIPSEQSYLLPSMMAANNRIKPGCAEAKIPEAIVNLEKEYIPLWKASR